MKEFCYLTVALLISSTMANAQLRVFSDGKMSLSTSDTPESKLSIGDAGNESYDLFVWGNHGGIYSMSHNNDLTSNWCNAGYFKTPHSSSAFYVGLQGISVSNTETNRDNGRAFGLLGRAGYATPGFNYGVFGQLDGTNAGAAVYGTTNRTENGIPLSRRYAGYFNGETGIEGNLYVSGYIYGDIIGEAGGMLPASAQNATNGSQKNVLDKLIGLKAQEYYKTPQATVQAAKNDTADTMLPMNIIAAQSLSKTHYALSAEQLEAVYPDLVYEKEDGTKGINYIELIPILVQAIGELNAKISILENNDETLRPMAKAKATTDYDAPRGSYDASIAQNIPNPFVDATNIRLTIPAHAKNATLYIYDMTGIQISQTTVTDRGNTSIKITNDGLNAGMYLYSLIVDGQLIDTKRMIVTK